MLKKKILPRAVNTSQHITIIGSGVKSASLLTTEIQLSYANMSPIRNKKLHKNINEQEGLKEKAIRDLKTSKISSIRKAGSIYCMLHMSFICKDGLVKSRFKYKKKLTSLSYHPNLKSRYSPKILASELSMRILPLLANSLIVYVLQCMSIESFIMISMILMRLVSNGPL